jgi:hypothetical protein
LQEFKEIANRTWRPFGTALALSFALAIESGSALLELLELLEQSGSIQNLRVHMNAGDAWNAKFQTAFQLGHHLMRFPERSLSGEFSFERDYQSLIRH